MPGKDENATKTWIFHKDLQMPGLTSVLLLTNMGSSWFVPGKTWGLWASPFTLLYSVSTAKQPLGPWFYRGLWPRKLQGCFWLAISSLYIKLKYLNRGILQAKFLLSFHDETTHQGGGKAFCHPKHLGNASTIYIAAYQARSAVRMPQDFVDASDTRKIMRTRLTTEWWSLLK